MYNLRQLCCLTDNEIDGEAFLELTIDDVKTMVPGKLGVVKKICRLIKLELVVS